MFCVVERGESWTTGPPTQGTNENRAKKEGKKGYLATWTDGAAATTGYSVHPQRDDGTTWIGTTEKRKSNDLRGPHVVH